MAVIHKYYLKPTALIPNSHYPLIHYKKLIDEPAANTGKVYDLYDSNGWNVNWIFRYGQTQASHYHSRSHECMTVLTGTATIRFGVADTSDSLEENTWGAAKEDGGVEVTAEAGDVFIIPAGVAHKTYGTAPAAAFQLLTPGTGHGIAASAGADRRQAVADVQLDGYTMMGAYPKGSDWDFLEGDADHSDWDNVWAIQKPDLDPVLGKSEEGIVGTWKGIEYYRQGATNRPRL